MDNSLYIINRNKQEEIVKIAKCNQYTQKYGLILTDKQINDVIEKRFDVLKETQRLEFGEWIIDKIIKEFCDSPYISNNNYSETLCELIDIFYYYKNETKDLITDDELIKFMKENFDGIAQGDLEYLAGTVLDKMANNVLNGRKMNYEINIENNERYNEDE